MKKQTKKVLTITFVISIILLILVFGKFPFAVTGSNTLSISQADLQSNNPYLSGKAWILTFSAGGLGQSYYGTITPGDIEEKTVGDLRPTSNLNINVVYDDTTCEYPIKTLSTIKPIYDIEYKEFFCVTPYSEGNTKTETGLNNILWYGKYSGRTVCFAYGYNTLSNVGFFSQTNVNAPYTITLNVGGKTATKTINPLTGSGQGSVGDYAYASWAGNLVSGASCPYTTDNPYIPVYVNDNWRLGDKQSYNDYLNLILKEPSKFSMDDNQILTNQIKNAIAKAKADNSFGTISGQGNFYNAILKYETPSPVQFPITTLYIKADTLGIFTPTPNINIVSTNSQCFSAGENGLISVIIKNTGDEGTFNAFATCPDPFSPSQKVTGSLASGESRTVNIPLSASASKKVTQSCQVSVETTGGTKTASVNVCVDPLITCTVPYPQKFCGISGGKEVVKRCSPDGATSSIIETCDSNEYCSNGACILGNPNPNPSIFDKIREFFSSLFGGLNDTLTILRYIVLIIAVILTVFTSKDFLQNKVLKKKSDKTINLILSLLIGLAVGIILYTILFTLFWYIVIGLIIFNIIIKFVIPWKR